MDNRKRKEKGYYVAGSFLNTNIRNIYAKPFSRQHNVLFNRMQLPSISSIFHKHFSETMGNEDASGNEVARKIRIKHTSESRGQHEITSISCI